MTRAGCAGVPGRLAFRHTAPDLGARASPAAWRSGKPPPGAVEGRGFIPAKRLARSDLSADPAGPAEGKGDRLRLATGGTVAITRIERRRGSFQVHNFTVAGTHTYFAGGVWVHNACPRPGVSVWQVGRARELWSRQVVGDRLAVHHVPQGHPANQVIAGYSYMDGTAIVIPEAIHRQLLNERGLFGGSPRALISSGLRQLHQAGVPRSALRELALEIRRFYPQAFQ